MKDRNTRRYINEGMRERDRSGSEDQLIVLQM